MGPCLFGKAQLTFDVPLFKFNKNQIRFLRKTQKRIEKNETLHFFYQKNHFREQLKERVNTFTQSPSARLEIRHSKQNREKYSFKFSPSLFQCRIKE